jgi:amino acid adenylation domain-containing protein
MGLREDMEFDLVSVPAVFRTCAECHPDAVAVSQSGASLSYGELSRRAARLGVELRERGAGPETVVGVCLERSLELILAFLGVLESGAAYLPLDPALPRERHDLLLEDSAAQVLLIHGPRVEHFAGVGVPTLDLDDLPSLTQGAPGSVPQLSGSNLVYICYTSGSTGQPKGVAVPHRGLLRMVREPNFGTFEGAVFLQLTTVAFDPSMLEIWGALLGGGRLAVAPPGRLTLVEIGATLRRERVTSSWLTAGLFHLMVEECPEDLGTLKQLIAGGDVLSPVRVKQVLELAQGPRMINGYGPTENSILTTCGVMARPADVGDTVPIGRPVQDTQVVVADSRLRAVGLGGVGELVTGGLGLARGYHGSPGQTAERFVPDPWGCEPGARVYRTGDLVRFLTDGRLEFLGRFDHQLKLRGIRIELGEIEAALLAEETVAAAVVVARENPAVEGLGDKLLVAYVVPRTPGEVSEAGLRSDLEQRLPAYMVPTAWVLLDALPLTTQGKVDRKALPEPEGLGQSKQAYVAPRNQTEELLASLWAEVLAVERVGMEDNFFELGGHSLLATRLMARLRDAFGVEVPLLELFDGPTVGLLAPAVASALETADGLTIPALGPMPRDGHPPLSFAQQRLWFLDQLEPGSPRYNMPLPLQADGPLVVDLLARSLTAVVERHESLRTSFLREAGEPVQVIGVATDFLLPLVDLQGLAAALRLGEAQRWAKEGAHSPFDLTRGPLLRMTLLRLASEEHVVLFNMHHIISDGWSMDVLMHEISTLYGGFEKGEPATLPELPIQYADYALWQRGWLHGETLEAEIAHWRGVLEGAPPVLELPLDRPRPAEQSLRGDSVPVELSPQVSEQLRGLSREHSATLFMTLLATFDLLLARYSGQRDIVVGTPIAGRTDLMTEGLIGFFVNTLVVRSQVAEGTFRELLESVRGSSLEAQAHQHLPFDRLVEELAPERSLSHSPIFQVLFSLQASGKAGAAESSQPEGGLQLQPLAEEEGAVIAKYDLSLSLADHDGVLGGLLEYSSDLFDRTTVERMARSWEHLVAAVAAVPENLLERFDGLSSITRHQLLVEWNDTAMELPVEDTIPAVFAARSARYPEAIAVSHGGQSLSYGELARRAAYLGAMLRERGLGPEKVVAVCVERSLELIVAFLGVLEAGAAYLPLDSELPKERHDLLLEDSSAQVLLTGRSLEQRFAAAEVPVLVLENLSFPASPFLFGGVPRVPPQVGSSSLVYLCYTSGSTGRPKGVAVPHRGLLRMVEKINFGSLLGEVFLQLTTVAFDPSMLEIWGALLHGGRLAMAPPGPPMLSELGATLRRERVTSSWLTAGLFHLMVEECLEDLGTLRQLIAGGDVLSPARVKQVLELANPPRMINGYGPTENSILTTCGVMFERSDVGETVAIGRPVQGTRVVVADRTLCAVVLGAVGELITGGLGLARGYHGRPGLTAEVFVPDPWSSEPGGRLYRTGDLVRCLADGRLEFLGRFDSQLKLRGFRIELGEIEAALIEDPAVVEAIVLALVGKRGEASDKHLTAYVVLEASGASTELAAALRVDLARRLPEYMVPAEILVLGSFPLTPNGKVDRLALAALDPIQQERSVERVMPRDRLENQLGQIWEAVLREPQISIHDNFFELGGHSLLAIQMLSRVENLLGEKLPVSALFKTPTIEGLAELMRGGAGPSAPSSLVPLVTAGGQEPIFWVHPVSGTVLFYRNLVGHLEVDRPLFGLQALGIDGDTAPFTRIDDMAAHYVAEVRSVQPHGPYFLGGWSMGGVIAVEMAHLLEAAGEEVAFLGLLDTQVPGRYDELLIADEMEMLALFLLNLGMNFDDLDLVQEVLHELGADRRLALILERALERELLPQEMTLGQLRRYFQILKANARANASHQPKACRRRLTLLRAIEPMPDADLDGEGTWKLIYRQWRSLVRWFRGRIWSRVSRSTMGWKGVPGMTVDLFRTPGHHFSILAEEHIAKLAEILTKELTLAEGELKHHDRSKEDER